MPVPSGSDELKNAISSGAVQVAFGRLLSAIEDDMRDQHAQDIIARLQGKASGSPQEKEDILGAIAAELRQRVFNLATYFVEELSRDQNHTMLAPPLEKLLRLDSAATHGVSDEGFQALEDCTAALVAQLREDWTNDALDQDTVSMLIGGGLGAAVVGELLITKYAGLQL